jgi:hypothetical protein
LPLPTLVKDPPSAPPRPLSEMTPLKVVELELPAVSVRLPSATTLSATPLRSWMVWLPVLPVMSNVAFAAVRLTLDDAMLPLPESASVPPLTVVTPV